MEGWEGRIGVRKNLPELLRRELKDWPKDEFLYLGSICDPFNEMEEQYGIAPRMLKGDRGVSDSGADHVFRQSSR